jgi:hypothetical protein
MTLRGAGCWTGEPMGYLSDLSSYSWPELNHLCPYTPHPGTCQNLHFDCPILHRDLTASDFGQFLIGQAGQAMYVDFNSISLSRILLTISLGLA